MRLRAYILIATSVAAISVLMIFGLIWLSRRDVLSTLQDGKGQIISFSGVHFVKWTPYFEYELMEPDGAGGFQVISKLAWFVMPFREMVLTDLVTDEER